jgi:Tol biopolymer transport system component
LNNLVNPYQAGRPVEKPDMFFGRDDALIWVEQQLTLDRRLLIVHGPGLIGKTSLVRRLPAFLAEHIQCLYFQGKPHRGRSLSQILAALAGDLANQLMSKSLVSPHQVDTAADSATAVKSLLQQAAFALDRAGATSKGRLPGSEEATRLLLILDDAHILVDGEPPSLDSFFDFLTTLLAQVPGLQLLLTLSDLSYERLAHPILLGAVAFRLGPLSSDAAQQLITRPALGALRFDAGVTKRIAEITSNHPYYLHLFCYTLYNCCARDGWVNQSDIDRTLETLLSLPNEQFQATWEESSRAEQAALSALAGLKGAHGPITRQEAINYLRRFDPRVIPDVVLDALESLADRGVLVRMGALSYRFAVNLFRYWLDHHTDPAEVLAGIDWERLRTQLAARSYVEEIEVGEPVSSGRQTEDEEADKRQWNPGTLSILGLAGTAFIGLLLLTLAFSGLLPTRTVDPTLTIQRSQAPGSFVSPTPSATPTTVPTPTPTRPLVVAHSLPAIVYMARGAANDAQAFTWQLFVMNADGTNRKQHSFSNTDDITPVWSPDGQRIAFVTQRDGNREIYLANADGSDLVNLTQHPSEDWTPAWSPDGKEIGFSSNRQGNWEIFVVNADGTNLRQITNDGTGNLSPVWSPDGKTMAFSSKRDGNWEIYSMPAPDSQGLVRGQQRRLTFAEGNDLSPLFSPQGDRIAFESNREGNVEVFVMPAPGAQTQVSADGSNQVNLSNLSFADDHGPVWSPDGRRLLFYSNREGNWDLFAMTATGESVVNLTNSPDMDEQAPSWRP